MWYYVRLLNGGFLKEFTQKANILHLVIVTGDLRNRRTVTNVACELSNFKAAFKQQTFPVLLRIISV